MADLVLKAFRKRRLRRTRSDKVSRKIVVSGAKAFANAKGGAWLAAGTHSKLARKRVALRSIETMFGSAHPKPLEGPTYAESSAQTGLRARFVRSRDHDRQPVRLSHGRRAARLRRGFPDSGKRLLRSDRGQTDDRPAHASPQTSWRRRRGNRLRRQ